MKKLLVFISLLTFNFQLSTLFAQSGIITTVAGSAGVGYSGNGGHATSADLHDDGGVAVDAAGNIYIADSYNNVIRKVNTSGNISNVAGNAYRAGNPAGGYSGNGGQATAAELADPIGVRVDSLGNIYFSDAGNALIRKVNTSGIITNIAGRPGIGGYSGNGGQATAAELNNPEGIGLDTHLNVYIADAGNNVIRKVTVSSGIITLVAGNHTAGYSGNGGQATAARLNAPAGVAVTGSGFMYIADFNNGAVRMVTSSGVISTYAGTGVSGFNNFSGPATTTRLYNPANVWVSSAGHIYVADAGNAVIWEVYPSDNQIYAIAGIVDDGYSGDGGPAYAAEVNYPFDAVADKSSNVYIADLNNNRVRKITAGCVASGTASAVSYNYPECYGSTDGIVFASSSSPFAPYKYSWSPSGATAEEVSNLPAADYTVTITDALGCTATASVDITQPAEIVVTTQNPTICAGGQVRLSATASGGAGGYTFEWITGNTTDTLSVGPPTTSPYTIYVSDHTGCIDSAIANVTVNQLPNVILNVEIASPCDSVTFDSLSGIPLGGKYNGPDLTGNVFDPALAGAGTYTVSYTYTDSNGCTNQTTQTINVISCGLTAAISPAGGCTLVASSSGTSPFTFAWSTGATASSISPASSTVYTVTITDNIGASASASYNYTLLSVTASSTNVACFGENDGAISASPVGGTSPYNYVWSNGGGTNQDASGLSAGTYQLTLTDSYGCSASTSAVITEPAALQISIQSITNIPCFGGTGSAVANAATGGTSPYVYSWSDNEGSGLAATGLSAGTYVITVTDVNGCSGTATAVITQPALLSASTSVNNVSCSGGNNGEASAIIAGGTSPFTYLWNDAGSQSTATAAGLVAGTYSVAVTDNNGCSATAAAIITQPSSLVAITILSVTGVTCSGGGSATANAATGGTPPYTYLWNDPAGQTALTALVLAAGTYTITATDNNGCTATASATITQVAGVSTVSIASVTGILCNGGTAGSATADSATGGTPPYTYQWSDANSQTSLTATGLPAGTYTLTATDNTGCIAQAVAVVTQPAILLATLGDFNVCSGSSIALAAAVSGGTAPYTYNWNTGYTGDTLTLTPAADTSFTVNVQDANGCSSTAVADVTVNPLPSVTLVAATYTACSTSTSDTLTGSPSGGIYSGPDLTGNIFNPSVAGVGSYSFIYTYTNVSGCSNTDTISINVEVCTGIQDLSDNEQITVYPNPATGQFTVRLQGAGVVQLMELYSITGQQVYEHKFTSPQNSRLSVINAQQFSTGLYFLKVTLQDGSALVQKVEIVK